MRRVSGAVLLLGSLVLVGVAWRQPVPRPASTRAAPWAPCFQIPKSITWPSPTARHVAGIPVRLRIPALGITVPIQSVGVHQGRIDMPPSAWTVAWLSTAPRPGEPGNALIVGDFRSLYG